MNAYSIFLVGLQRRRLRRYLILIGKGRLRRINKHGVGGGAAGMVWRQRIRSNTLGGLSWQWQLGLHKGGYHSATGGAHCRLGIAWRHAGRIASRWRSTERNEFFHDRRRWRPWRHMRAACCSIAACVCAVPQRYRRQGGGSQLRLGSAHCRAVGGWHELNSWRVFLRLDLISPPLVAVCEDCKRPAEELSGNLIREHS
jgi:hypothetical protein